MMNMPGSLNLKCDQPVNFNTGRALPFNLAEFAKSFNEHADRAALSQLTRARYLNWALRFFRYFERQHLAQLNQANLEDYLSYLSNKLNFDVSTQKFAESALRFLFKSFLNVEFGNLHISRRPTRRGFFSNYQRQDSLTIIQRLKGTSQLIAQLAFEAQLTLEEVLHLRLSDIDLKLNELVIRDKRGATQFKVNIPLNLILSLKIQTMRVRSLVQDEKHKEFGDEFSDLAILAKQLEPEWQYLFPLGNHIKTRSGNKDRSTNKLDQYPLTLIQSDIKFAARTLSDAKRKGAITTKVIRNPIAQNSLKQDIIDLNNHSDTKRQNAFPFLSKKTINLSENVA